LARKPPSAVRPGFRLSLTFRFPHCHGEPNDFWTRIHTDGDGSKSETSETFIGPAMKSRELDGVASATIRENPFVNGSDAWKSPR
jgi:hypothetical protein